MAFSLMRVRFLHIVLILFSGIAFGQTKPEFKGQFSSLGNYAHDNSQPYFLSTRYLPQLDYQNQIDSNKVFDFELSLNCNVNYITDLTNRDSLSMDLSLYRAWIRYYTGQLEIRAGLQKIDFGSSVMIRPVQWFNEIDPRDPLQLTGGVNALLGRYYFLNNSNLWVWGLYGNDGRRGFNSGTSLSERPEFGARYQLTKLGGDIALSAHNRYVEEYNGDTLNETILGFDARWDVGVGLWVEACHNFGNSLIQDAATVGMDYTFGIGHGLMLLSEHAYMNTLDAVSSDDVFLSAVMLSYPLGMFHSIGAYYYHLWEANTGAFTVNYQYMFPKFTVNCQLYYNPDNSFGVIENELVYNFAGPGFRFMFIYNH